MIDMISDDKLTTDGLKNEYSEKSNNILLLACGALAREILTLKSLNSWAGMDLQCLPANLHLFPNKIPDAVATAVEKNKDFYSKIFVVYADCGTGGLLKNKCDQLGVEMIEGPHCYSFFDGNETFNKNMENEITSFYLTDFFVCLFDAFVWQPMGLDKYPELRDTIFGNYEKVIYLAQTNDPSLTKKAMEAAKRLSLKFERRFTGYGDLYKTLSKVSE